MDLGYISGRMKQWREEDLDMTERDLRSGGLVVSVHVCAACTNRVWTCATAPPAACEVCGNDTWRTSADLGRAFEAPAMMGRAPMASHLVVGALSSRDAR